MPAGAGNVETVFDVMPGVGKAKPAQEIRRESAAVSATSTRTELKLPSGTRRGAAELLVI